MKEINTRTKLVTVSLGSGSDADVMFLFTSDICGETSDIPRHARAYGNLATLRAKIVEERISAMTAYRSDVADQSFPNKSELANIDANELKLFREAINN